MSQTAPYNANSILSALDNHAIGYFKNKCLFVIEICGVWSNCNSRWNCVIGAWCRRGYIKDYEGAVHWWWFAIIFTLPCAAKTCYWDRIKVISKSHTIYKGIEDFVKSSKRYPWNRVLFYQHCSSFFPVCKQMHTEMKTVVNSPSKSHSKGPLHHMLKKISVGDEGACVSVPTYNCRAWLPPIFHQISMG
jgi:hypothetical protein